MCFLASCGLAQEVPVPVPIAESSSKYSEAIEAHMDYVTENAVDEFGEQHTGMWLATIDIKTNGLPNEPLPKQLRRNGELAQQALRVARYSFQQRDQHTGLVRNQPVDKRWDYYASTTELGLWAGSLLRASEYTGNAEFQQIAEDALRVVAEIRLRCQRGQILWKSVCRKWQAGRAEAASWLHAADVRGSIRSA